ncbi:MAG: fluoride efflux transporter FluC [Bacillota bacterium]
MTWVLIGVAGAAGALARLAMGGWMASRRGSAGFPWATFAVNLLGSFLLGLLTGLALGRGALSPTVKAMLGAGFLGAFTTFSTWQAEMFRTYQQGERQMAWANLLLSTGAGLLAAWLGIALGWRL